MGRQKALTSGKKLAKKSKSKANAISMGRRALQPAIKPKVARGRRRVEISGGISEFAKGIADGVGWDIEAYHNWESTSYDPNPIHRNPKFTGLHLMYEMDTDSRIYTVMRSRKIALERRPSWIRPTEEVDEQYRQAAFLVYCMKQINALRSKKKEIKSDLDFGYSVTEIKLKRETVRLKYRAPGDKDEREFTLPNAITVADLAPRVVTAFWFDHMGRVYFRGNRFKSNGEPNDQPFQEPRPLTPRQLMHFIISTHDPRAGSRYGWPPKVAMFPPYLMKRAAKLWRLIYVERFGMPIPHGKYKPGTSKPLRDEFKARLKALQHATYLMTPENFSIEFLEAMNTASFDPYQSLIDYADFEIVEAGLGHREAVSTTGSGSYASEVLKSTALRQEILEADGGDLDTVINDQLLYRLLYWNFNLTSNQHPKQLTNVDATRDKNAIITQYQTGHAMGKDLSKSQINEDMGWREPSSPEDTLKGNPRAQFNDRSPLESRKKLAERLNKLERAIEELHAGNAAYVR